MSTIRIITSAILAILVFNGCASTPGTYLLHKADFGMTKEDLFKSAGSPSGWTRQVIDGHTYETWHYAFFTETYDFVDNSLVGFSSRGCYYSEDSKEDVRDYSDNLTPESKFE